MKRWVVIAVAFAACAPSQEVWGGRTPTREIQAVQSVIVRYLTKFYDPADYLGTPTAVCLSVATPTRPLDRTAMRLSARDTGMDPEQVLISQLRDVSPRVIPISGCAWGSSLEEVQVGNGERAIAMGIGYPQWITPNLARVQASIRENSEIFYGYTCTALRGDSGWAIRDCI